MKLFTGFLFAFSFLLITSCDTGTPEKAAEYNDNLLATLDQLDETIQEMDDTFISYVPEEMNKAYDALKNQVAATQKELEDLGKYYGDARLQEAALGYVKAVEESLPLYTERIKIESVSDDEFTDEMGDRSFEISDDIYAKIDVANKKLIEVQKQFSADHKYDLENRPAK